MATALTTPRPRTAVLLDLENILHVEEDPAPGTVPCCESDHTVAVHDVRTSHRGTGAWVCDEVASRTLAEIRTMAGEADYWLAAAAAPLLAQVAFLPEVAGIALRAVPDLPDAADQYLLHAAEHLAAHGFDRFVVVSGDHVFTRVAALAPTTVIARSVRTASTELRMRATKTYFLSARCAAAVEVPA